MSHFGSSHMFFIISVFAMEICDLLMVVLHKDCQLTEGSCDNGYHFFSKKIFKDDMYISRHKDIMHLIDGNIVLTFNYF